MAYPYRGVSGLAAGAFLVGGILVYSSIKNASVADTLRSVIKGQPVKGSDSGSLQSYGKAISSNIDSLANSITPQTQQGSNLQPVAGGVLGGLIAAQAKGHIGAPYVFGAAGPNSFDCSGLVNYVLGKEMHLAIPGHSDGSFSGHGPVTGEYYVWSAGSSTVDSSQMQAGDLVCWTGHIGIATDGQNMVHAPHSGTTVQISKVWFTPPPLIRRLNVVTNASAGEAPALPQ